MAGRILGAKEETEVMGAGVHERYHRLLDDLEREMNLG